jgi:hypothetical protein
MYQVIDYLTDDVVAVCSRKSDAVAMIRSELDQKLIIRKVKKEVDKP